MEWTTCRCGKAVHVEEVRCPRCGAEMDGGVAAPAATAPVAAAPAAPPPSRVSPPPPPPPAVAPPSARFAAVSDTGSPSPRRFSALLWLPVIACALLGQEIAQVVAFLAAKAAGVESPGATPHVAALERSLEAATPGRFFGAIAAWLVGFGVATRRSVLAGVLWGLLAGCGAAAVAGWLVGRGTM